MIIIVITILYLIVIYLLSVSILINKFGMVVVWYACHNWLVQVQYNSQHMILPIPWIMTLHCTIKSYKYDWSLKHFR